MIFDFIDRGVGRETALQAIRDSLDALKIVPSTIGNVADRSLAVDLLGARCALPVAVAPTAFSSLVWRDGEVEMARAAAQAGIPYCIATHSTVSMEDIAAKAGGTLWFQLYLWQRRELSFALLDRARAVGVDVVALTVDTAAKPKRDYNIRNGFGVRMRPTWRGVFDLSRHPGWVVSVLLPQLLAGGAPDLVHRPPELLRRNRPSEAAMRDVAVASDLDWNDVARLRDRWKGKLLLKGVMNEGDARRACELGLDGIVVSNHGGRNFDAAPPPLSVLSKIAPELGSKITILADGGISSGLDILRYLACGARGVLLGRAPLFGMAAAGRCGAVRVLEILRDELDRVLALAGRRSVGEVAGDLVWRDER